MTSMRPPRLLTAAAALALALLGAATAVVVARAGSSTPVKATVTITEREFRITPSTRKTPAGRVRFVVRNTGKYPHALAIRGAGVDQHVVDHDHVVDDHGRHDDRAAGLLAVPALRALAHEPLAGRAHERHR